MLVILREKTKNSRTRSYPTLVIQVSLQVIDLDLKLRFGFGEAGIGSVQFLHLVLKIEILLSQSSLEAIEIVVLAGQIVDLDSQSGNGSLQRVDLGISGGLQKKTKNFKTIDQNFIHTAENHKNLNYFQSNYVTHSATNLWFTETLIISLKKVDFNDQLTLLFLYSTK